jgi:hypothetical protein
MNALLRCLVSKGIFIHERAVEIKSTEGPMSLFVDEDFVVLKEELNGIALPGQLRVKLIESHPKAPLIQLPPQSSPDSNRVRVPAGELTT